MKRLFVQKSTLYNLQVISRLDLPRIKAVSCGIQSAVFLGSALWYAVPNEAKNSITIHDFKSFINHWKGQKNVPVGYAGSTWCKSAS